MALLISASASVAAACSSATPEFCTEKQLCMRGTEASGAWTTVATVQPIVREAKRRGVSCGGVEINAEGELPQCRNDNYRHNCNGTAKYTDGSLYVGEWENNFRHGNGYLKYAGGGLQYLGEWKNGKPNGQGLSNHPNGENQYVGEWREGQPNGKGITKFLNGDMYEGGFKNGKLDGQGTYKSASGEYTIGIWKNDELVSQTANLFGKSDFNSLSSKRRKQLQYGLKRLGYYTSSIDGKYGPNTQRAVRGYAKVKGITSDYPLSVYYSIILDVDVPSSFAAAPQSTGGSSSSSGGSDAGNVLIRGAAVALVCALTPNAAACLDGAMGNKRKYGSSSGSGNSTVSSNSCNSDYDCAYSSVCIKRAGQGQCMKLPRGTSRSNFEAIECSNNSDCPSKSKCNRTYKICVKKY
jgi:hypothetical protein